jgi:hypothetical protein
LPPSYLFPVGYYGGVNTPGTYLANPQRPETTVPTYSYWAMPTDLESRHAAASRSAAPKRQTLLSRFLARFQGDGHNHAHGKAPTCTEPGCGCKCHAAQPSVQLPAPAPAPAEASTPEAPAIDDGRLP